VRGRRCDMLGMSHSAEVIASTCPRTPEEQSDRCPCARRSDCAEASFWRFNSFCFCCRFDAYWGRFRRCSARLRRSSALSRWRAHRIKLVVERSRFRQQVSTSSVPRYQAATCFDQNGLSALAHERRDAIGDSPMQQDTREPEMEREHIIEGTYWFGRLRRRDGEGVTARE
jgi:hypothetical protein